MFIEGYEHRIPVRLHDIAGEAKFVRVDAFDGSIDDVTFGIEYDEATGGELITDASVSQVDEF